MRKPRTNRERHTARRVVLFVGNLVFALFHVNGQALLQVGNYPPYTLQEVVQPFARIDGVDSVVVLGRRHIAVRKSGEGVFRLYTNQLRMVSSVPVSEIIAGDDGLLSFCFDGKWGLADTSGRVLIKPRFDDAGAFREGLIAFRDGSCWGFMTRAGKWQIKPKFNCEIENFRPEFSGGFAVVYDAGAGGWRYLSREGKIINQRAFAYAYPFRFGHAWMQEQDGMYLINRNAEVELGPYDDAIPVPPTSVVPYFKNSRFGLVNIDRAEELTPALYLEISAPHNGFAAVLGDNGWTIIDTSGNTCRNDYFESLEFAEGNSFIFGNGSYDDRWLGLVAADCSVLLPAQWKWLGRFHCGVAVAAKQVMDYSFIDEKGEPVLPELRFSRSGNPAGGYINIIHENMQRIVDLKQRSIVSELEFNTEDTLELIELR
jgi:hypothetical protein